MTGFLIVIVGVVTAPIVANQVASATGSANTTLPTNFTNGSGTILGLTTLFYVLSIAVAAMNIAVTGLRQAGLIA